MVRKGTICHLFCGVNRARSQRMRESGGGGVRMRDVTRTRMSSATLMRRHSRLFVFTHLAGKAK